MKKLLFAFFVLCIGCPAIGADDAVLINRAKAAIGRDLLDPYSARWEGVKVKKSFDGKPAVCGEVNAKNTYGAYVGRKLFFYVSDARYGMAGSSSENEYIIACEPVLAAFKTRQALEAKAAEAAKKKEAELAAVRAAQEAREQEERDEAAALCSTGDWGPSAAGLCGELYANCWGFAKGMDRSPQELFMFNCRRKGFDAAMAAWKSMPASVGGWPSPAAILVPATSK